ncbi:DegV family protein [Clostridium sp. Cult2]|uniref:DegV family protein n=1 Tax=Clostridium sp. Cult2 TaxID=2079003 RepID=UPI001F1A626D|nr:DegV family protein [Clostridium sp. Cult2]
MSRIKIITDTTSYITKEFADEQDLSIVPLNYIFDGVAEKEGFPGEFDEFYEKLKNTKLFPTTSQPAAADFLTRYKKAFNEGYDEIIAILLSSKLSGTYNSAVLAKNILEDERITIIDSIQAASNLRFLVEDALKMASIGKTGKEIAEHLEVKKKKMYIYFTVDTLEYLRRGGRLTGVQSAIGEVLNIKPIIQLIDGELKLFEKVRGKNKAINAIRNRIPDDVEKISICQIMNEDEALKLKKDLENKFPKVTVSIDVLGPVIGCHLGPKAIGLCFY